MHSEAYQKMLKRIQNTDLNQDPEWRKARQAELDRDWFVDGQEIYLTSKWFDSRRGSKTRRSVSTRCSAFDPFCHGGVEYFSPDSGFRNLVWFARCKVSRAQNVYKLERLSNGTRFKRFTTNDH